MNSRRFAALVSQIFWLLSYTMGGSGEASFVVMSTVWTGRVCEHYDRVQKVVLKCKRILGHDHHWTTTHFSDVIIHAGNNQISRKPTEEYYGWISRHGRPWKSQRNRHNVRCFNYPAWQPAALLLSHRKRSSFLSRHSAHSALLPLLDKNGNTFRLC